MGLFVGGARAPPASQLAPKSGENPPPLGGMGTLVTLQIPRGKMDWKVFSLFYLVILCHLQKAQGDIYGLSAFPRALIITDWSKDQDQSLVVCKQGLEPATYPKPIHDYCDWFRSCESVAINSCALPWCKSTLETGKASYFRGKYRCCRVLPTMLFPPEILLAVKVLSKHLQHLRRHGSVLLDFKLVAL
ncbi:UNVERIFIED_CONTAM: hypothetical protein K2H54_015988 [Gekko kuhli]